MCGIVGYSGRREAEPILLEGLSRLEYRGYDSAGVATMTGASLCVRKCVGRIANLKALLERQPAPGTCGISHTRWATHGGVTDANAHPHLGGDGAVAVVHNGVIENYADLKRELTAEGVTFHSETDTEVIAQLIASYLDDDLVDAVRKALARLKGTYGLAVISPRFPGLVVGARLGSPLVVGLGDKEQILASDPSALVGHTEQVIYLKDRELCVLSGDAWEIQNGTSEAIEAQIHSLDWEVADVDLGDFEHYMLKEIYEQPEVIERAMAGRLDEAEGTAHLGGLNLAA